MDYTNILLLISLISLSGILAQQRSPPGVNPQQYQGQPNAGQYQQPPPPPPPQQQQQYNQMGGAPPGVPPGQYQQQQQYQQHPPAPQAPQQQQQQFQQQQHQQPQQPQQQQQQYQPPPPQQQQQQFQQPPVQHGAGGHNHPEQQRVLHSGSMQDERDHIKDHMEVPLDTSGMSEEELQYHYFKMHDADGNNRLDGQELIKSLFHWHDSSNHDAAKSGQTPPPPKIFTDEELVNMIDPIMDQDDRNRDGYIDYAEFVQAQSKAAAAASAGGT